MSSSTPTGGTPQQPQDEQPEGKQPEGQQPGGQQPGGQQYGQPGQQYTPLAQSGQQYSPPAQQYGQPGQQYGQSGQQQGQAPYGQPGQQGQAPYGQPGQQYGAPGPQQSKVLAIVALVLGGLAFLMSWIPIVNVVAIAMAIAGAVCGVIALVRKLGGKPLAITGVALSGVAIIISIAMTLLAAAVLSTTAGELSKISETFSAQANAEHTVQYKVTTSAPADVDYGDANGTKTEQITENWDKEFTETGFFIGHVSVMANFDTEADVSCQIIIDGVVVSEDASSGTGAMAICTGSLN
ncbi:DUF4190 domain-containing protein [Sinomonas mesophila]|uniref:DUF4190 domain-containing protein n=1 Tax=Sinomonas mesophila TaxID=1531955 RepID=UPI000987C1CF|nr:DUF4190 domain-containing protein [Sinomonas mesophila]